MLKTIHTSLILGTALTVFLFLALSVSAQGTDSGVSLEQTPSFPEPNEEVSFGLSSFSVDLGRSEIFWYVNDVLTAQGVGANTFRFTAGPAGSVSRVDVIVRGTRGERIAESATIRPAGVDLLWEAHTYTPPFYKGLPLPASKSIILLTAVPHITSGHGARLGPGDLVFTWEQDGLVLGRASGLGKDSIALQAKSIELGRTSVTVTVSSFDEPVRAQKTVSVRTRAPQIRFYEKHPLEGVLLGKTLGNGFTLSEEEFVLRAEPYRFSLDNFASEELEYHWSFNGADIPPTNEDPRDLTLRLEGAEQGTAEIGLEIKNMSRLLQSAKNVLSLRFEAPGIFIRQ